MYVRERQKARSCQAGYRKKERPQAMKEDVIDMMLLIKERSGTTEEEKRGLEMLYTLTLLNTAVSLGLEQEISNPAATVIV